MVLLGGPGGQGRSFIGHPVSKGESSMVNRYKVYRLPSSMAVMPKRPTNHTNDSVWGVDQRRTSTQGSVRATRWLIWGSLV
ncbi:uncharacterized protein PGTG_21769 [Puccinia graminis f. sp. tritici CRL 75-36-700-3]|uniref:Uncharacterized protein n=1 Tax=Puccinia graminis f. sp. tritici (strain CRL 75-36-700-3 / race SCCL) TaxID=418459 RepID=H6QSE7_PUCGT|nr:uncharacterized protein PGTG_21769 [Puccinia graminis f. sp. tritici CRL 75-36-700-3]EHS63683.1 hypothetical protein PGTG_21769 [Puccinia graminis f. sp. tritici CRL 75-36-700-3]